MNRSAACSRYAEESCEAAEATAPNGSTPRGCSGFDPALRLWGMQPGAEAVCVPERCHGRGVGLRPPVPAALEGGLRLADAQPAGGVRRLPLPAARGLWV